MYFTVTQFSIMEISVVEGFLYTIMLWISSLVYNKVHKYLKNKSSTVGKELYSAVCNGNLQELKKILSSSSVDVNIRIGRDRNTLLHYASTAEVTEELLNYGAIVDSLNEDEMSPLFFAVIDNKGLAVIRVLLRRGANPNLKSNDGHTALHFVPCLTEKEGLEVVRELLKYGVNVNTMNSDYATPLFFAVMCETNLDIVKELLINGADINVRGRYPFTTRFFTPLDLAVDEEKMPYAKMIIKISLMKNFDKDYIQIIDLDSYRGTFDYAELSVFLEKCISELTSMKNFQINSNVTLYEFISKISYDQENIKPLYSTEIIIENEICSMYPIYSDIFWPCMKLCLERAQLLSKLSQLQVYVGPGPLAEEEEIVLNHDCMYTIGEYLSNDDLYNFISGFEKVFLSCNMLRTTIWN